MRIGEWHASSLMRVARFGSVLGALAALGLSVAAPDARATPARLSELALSKVGRYLLLETYEGKALTQLVTGTEAATDAQLRTFLQSLGQRRYQALGRELETRLTRADERFRVNRERILSEDARITRLTQSDRQILETLAGEELQTIEQSGRVRFEAPSEGSPYRARRDEFLEAGNRVVPGAFAEGFPSSLSTGSLRTRVTRFLGKWPRNAKLVDDVVFKLEAGGSTYEGRRQVLVVSTKGMSEAAQARLLRDYLAAFGRGTVSFPLTRSAGHLHTRLGTKDLGFINEVDIEAYRLGGSERLEPIVELTPQEEARLRTYVEQAFRRPTRVLGDFGYDGAGSGQTRGRLDDNRPLRGEQHNCTSWMATAPVGPRGEPLFELVGSRSGWNIHTNPGWWSNFLMVSSPVERVPMAVFWTQQSLAEASHAVRPGRHFEWDFGTH